MKASTVILAVQAALLIPENVRAPRVGPKTITAFNKLRGLKPDDDYPEPVTVIAQQPSSELPPTSPVSGEISQEAIDLILASEGVDQPYAWPGGGSGITLGYGCDIGADPQSLAYWRDELTKDQMDRLAVAKGVTGQAANALESRFRDIKVTKDASLRVFYRYTLPIEIAKTKAAFPGSELLPPPALGALVSVVFNRGTSRKGSRRVDMQDIYDILIDGVQSGDLKKLAKQFRDMKVLWEGVGLDGLITRREREAKLVESAIV